MIAPASRLSRRRSRRTVVMVFVLVVVLTAAAAVTWSVFASNDRNKTARVDDDGFAISVADTRISAPAGVAPEGTTVTAAATTADVSDAVFGAATALHEGVDITLEDGAQPEVPVQMEFRIPKDVPVPDGDAVFVLAYSEGQENPDILPAQWNPELRTVSTTVEHFSTVQAVTVNQDSLVEGFATEMGKAYSSRTDQPECFGQDPLDGNGSIVVSPIANDAVWPCLFLEGDTLILGLQNNAPLIWTAVSEPQGFSGSANSSTIAGAFTVMVHPMIEGSRAGGQHLLLQGEPTEIRYDVSELPITARLDAMPALMLASIAVGAAVSIAPDGILLLELMEVAECMAGVIRVIVEDSSLTEVMHTSLTCVGVVAGAAGGQIISMLTEHPASLNGAVTGLIGEFTGDNRISFDIKLNVPATAPRLEDGTRHLWEVGSSRGLLTTYPSGDSTDSLVVDDGLTSLWASSTSQWVGCDGNTARTRYLLDGDYTGMSTTAALRAGTPEGLTSRFEFEVDGKAIHTSSVTTGTIGEPFDLDLTGADELVVTASTNDECSFETTGYGVLRATVTEAREQGDVDTAALEGSWFGPVDQGSRDYDIELELNESDGVLEGKVYYPQLKCGGTWTQRGEEPGFVLLREEITENLEGNCVRRVDVELNPTSEGLNISLDPLTPLASHGTAKATRR